MMISPSTRAMPTSSLFSPRKESCRATPRPASEETGSADQQSPARPRKYDPRDAPARAPPFASSRKVLALGPALAARGGVRFGAMGMTARDELARALGLMRLLLISTLSEGPMP